ncbi:hypothetical protein TSOC_006886 [Tetrabaena socialis]|uniref:Peptidase M11 gametolysin domain-containing protein n=1 Tax=Tetrabaena socialis TaxID=47790 RepID=A0A2J8A2H1_9CHLO|nr:hypothetical protein TSOC_006886 [Tetrabaena socialis]|eukprot:PNH06719.1 hypothetical protein TSOC_006886 [Tetrabaena socialis]
MGSPVSVVLCLVVACVLATEAWAGDVAGARRQQLVTVRLPRQQPDHDVIATVAEARETQSKRRLKTSALSTLDLPTDARWQAPPLRVIIFITNMCDKGGGAATKQEDVWRMLRDGNINLADYYDTCSYGKATIDVERSLVVGPITLPCSGTTSGGSGAKPEPWTVTSCHDNNPFGWFNWAEQYTVKTMGVNLTVFNHRIMIMPKLHQNFQVAGGTHAVVAAAAAEGRRYALIGVCVRTGDDDFEVNCADGLDDDCDGLVDMKDPDCRRPPNKNDRAARPPPVGRGTADDGDNVTPGLIYEGLLHRVVLVASGRPTPSAVSSSGSSKDASGGSGSVEEVAAAKSAKVASGRRRMLR